MLDPTIVITKEAVELIFKLRTNTPSSSPAPPQEKPTDLPSGHPRNITTTGADTILDATATSFIGQLRGPGKESSKNPKLVKIRDRLVSLENRIRMLESHEQEIEERSAYNVDLSAALPQVSTRLKEIPFRDSHEARRPPMKDLPKVGSKGKKRKLDVEPVTEESYESGWASRVLVGLDADVEMTDIPLGPMAMPEWVQKFDNLFAIVLPHLFGPDADHQCAYRELLIKLLRDEFLQLSIEDSIGMPLSIQYFCLLIFISRITRGGRGRSND